MIRTWPWMAAACGLSLSCAHAQHHGAGLPFTEGFENYHPGVFPCDTTGCVGSGGWGVWFYNYQGGPAPASITGQNAHEGTRSLHLSPRSDVVRTGNLTSGAWEITMQVWFPVEATTSPDAGNVIIFNESDGQAPEGFAIIILFEGVSGFVKSIFEPDNIVPLVRGQWAPLQITIDLAANTHSITYNGQPLVTDKSYAVEGPIAIQCFNLYSEGVEGMLVDTITFKSLGPPDPPCYPNCDESTADPILNVLDFNCYMNRFAAGDSYANCDQSTGVPSLNVLDFNCFLNRFTDGCP